MKGSQMNVQTGIAVGRFAFHRVRQEPPDFATQKLLAD
jgi:hypothetical protein